MKTVRTSLVCLLSVFASIALTGCDLDNDPELGLSEWDTIEVTIEPADGIKYFSLTTGEEVTGEAINTTGWDIGFQRPRTILTNSGVTAAELGSGGLGMVWYSEKNDMKGVVQDDAIDDVTSGVFLQGAYNTDVIRYFNSMSTTSPITYNVINFAGYETGTGSQNNPFITATYDKKQFYRRQSSSNYPVTGVVYIIRHGDGAHYSAIRVSDYEYAASADTYVVEFANF